MDNKPFSIDLENWLKSKGTKTFASLTDVFAEKSFAMAFLLLMSIPALPIPTGGLTHFFEAIAMLLALELIIGRQTIWLPKRWRKAKLGKRTTKQALPFLMRRVRWFEKFSRPRLSSLIANRVFRSGIGMVVFLLCLAAFLSPPFSGLDTIPSLAVVIMSIGLILEDILIVIMGIFLGVAGLAVVVVLGKVVFGSLPLLI